MIQKAKRQRVSVPLTARGRKLLQHIQLSDFVAADGKNSRLPPDERRTYLPSSQAMLKFWLG